LFFLEIVLAVWTWFGTFILTTVTTTLRFVFCLRVPLLSRVASDGCLGFGHQQVYFTLAFEFCAETSLRFIFPGFGHQEVSRCLQLLRCPGVKVMCVSARHSLQMAPSSVGNLFNIERSSLTTIAALISGNTLVQILCKKMSGRLE
jgi:hypothetical protein